MKKEITNAAKTVDAIYRESKDVGKRSCTSSLAANQIPIIKQGEKEGGLLSLL